MGKVTIYQFEAYDVSADEIRKSRRWGTLAAIETIARGRAMLDTATEVDESTVMSDIQGLTVRDWRPSSSSGFQKTVR